MNKAFFMEIGIENPVVKNHVIMGQALLPGFAYVDMLYQFAINGLGLDPFGYSLDKLTILKPLIVSPQLPQGIKVSFEQKSGYWSIGVLGVDGRKRETGEVFIRAEMRPNGQKLEKRIDYGALVKGAGDNRLDLSEIYGKAVGRQLAHAGMMLTNGAIYRHGNGLLIDVSIDGKYRGMVSEMLFQPMLIDGSAMAATYSIEEDETFAHKGSLLIPLSFEGFYCGGYLRERCFATVDRDSVRIVNDIIVYDMDFFGADGSQVASLRGVTSKVARNFSLPSPTEKTPTLPQNPAKPIQGRDTGKGQIGAGAAGRDIESTLKAIFSRFLQKTIDQMIPDASFFELGLESSVLLNIVHEIEDSFAVSLNTSVLFEYHTIRELTLHLQEKIGAASLAVSPPQPGAAADDAGLGYRTIPVDRQYAVSPEAAGLGDYMAWGKHSVPPTHYISYAVDAYARAKPDAFPVRLNEIEFTAWPQPFDAADKVNLAVGFGEAGAKGNLTVSVKSSAVDQGTLACKVNGFETIHESAPTINLAELIKVARKLDGSTVESCYATVGGHAFGPGNRVIGTIYRLGESSLLCSVDASPIRQARRESPLALEPAILLSCYLLTNAVPVKPTQPNFIMPISLGELTVFREIPPQAYIMVSLSHENRGATSFDALILAATGEVLAELKKATIKHYGEAEMGLLASLPSVRPAGKTQKEIAIIGLAGKYPGAENVEEFYENLKNSKDSITEIPESRWQWKDYFSPDRGKAGSIYCKWGGFIDGFDEFDPLFFNISPSDAEIMDPQERLFLQCCYHALEDAGYTRNNLSAGEGKHGRNKVGVYVGVMWDDYQLHGVEEQSRGRQVALSDNAASIANRVSYIFNFHGPSLVLNSACSSSLSAIHLACQSIALGESELALAGGVNICLHPNKYLFLSSAGFISSKGRCESFGVGADGYVPGEGVGAILLKPLDKAVADGDHIYGVIRGSMINSGGKASGFTVPSPKAQEEVIAGAILAAGIDARAISYVETHGTGTSLGDPIEVKGLADAFGAKASDGQYCRIGSVKSNIGHLESAAGIAGVTKILLQMKHGQIVPSLHSKTLNPNIDFSSTPFIVQQELTEWRRPVSGEGEAAGELPRTAGISSFGAGGSNAHLLISEYLPLAAQAPEFQHSQQNPAVIILSAKDSDRLRELSISLLNFLKAPAFPGYSLAEIAYTLQVGRETMEERLAMVVDSLPDLIDKIEAFASGASVSAGCFRGKAKSGELAALGTDDDMAATIDQWFAKRKHGKLAELWAKGLAIDLGKLYGGKKPRRVSLPGYPFAKERYWAPIQAGAPMKTANAGAGGLIHPLLHQNTSDFFEQRFCSEFRGEEFFLRDHVVGGQAVLPGVAYLEMARVAVAYATGAGPAGEIGIQLKDVAWVRPMAVGEAGLVAHIALNPAENGEIAYEVYSEHPENADERIIYSQGTAGFVNRDPGAVIDLVAIRAACEPTGTDIDQYYADFHNQGIEYGPGFRAIAGLWRGKGQVLAELALPQSVFSAWENFAMHPSLLDAALHASAGLTPIGGSPNGTAAAKSSQAKLPFALDRLEMFRPCLPSMWAYVRHAPNYSAGDPVECIDIDLCDPEGTVCVRMRGFSTRPMHGPQVPAVEAAPESMREVQPEAIGALTLCPVWEPLSPAGASSAQPIGNSAIVVGGTKAQIDCLSLVSQIAGALKIGANDGSSKIAQKLGKLPNFDHIVWFAPSCAWERLGGETALKGQNQGVIQLFRIVKALLELGYQDKSLTVTAITAQALAVFKTEPVNPTHASVHGLIGSLAKEFPQWKVRVLDLDAQPGLPEASFRQLPIDLRGRSLAHRGGQWYRQQLLQCLLPQPASPVYREGGVYLVVGGAGNVGRAWTAYAIKTYRARVIWIGRRQKDAAIEGHLAALAEFGPAPMYISADAADPKALRLAHAEIKKRFPAIHGVIHSALDLREQSLAELPEEEFRSGLASKVDVSLNLAREFQSENLDFLLFFSSVIAFIKNPRQSYYAAGCSFGDAYAHQLGLELPFAVKTINWGYWDTDAARASDRVKDLNDIGVGLIELPEAMTALEGLLAGGASQIGLMKITKPIAIEGMNRDEYLRSLPEQSKPAMDAMRRTGAALGAVAGRLQAEYDRHAKEIDDLATKLLWVQLDTMGVFGGKPAGLGDLKQRIGLFDLYGRWFDETMVILAKAGYLSIDGGIPTALVKDRMSPQAMWSEWERMKTSWLRDANHRSRVTLLEATLRALPDILTRKALSTDVIFPGSSMGLVEDIYKNNPLSDFFNGALADAVVAYVKERLESDGGARIRILEIGAGTGGTSAPVFSRLQAYRDNIGEYCYTDLSKAFLMYAEANYGPQNPYLAYSILNVEKPLGPQGIPIGEYDLVIAANALHATKNIHQTLRHAKAALKANGLLVLNEMSMGNLFLHLTFGLLEGWWLHEDSGLRIPGCPGLYPEAWRAALETEGYRRVYFPVDAARSLGQQIIVAESDGSIRLKQNNDQKIIFGS